MCKFDVYGIRTKDSKILHKIIIADSYSKVYDCLRAKGYNALQVDLIEG